MVRFSQTMHRTTSVQVHISSSWKNMTCCIQRSVLPSSCVHTIRSYAKWLWSECDPYLISSGEISWPQEFSESLAFSLCRNQVRQWSNEIEHTENKLNTFHVCLALAQPSFDKFVFAVQVLQHDDNIYFEVNKKIRNVYHLQAIQAQFQGLIVIQSVLAQKSINTLLATPMISHQIRTKFSHQYRLM